VIYLLTIYAAFCLAFAHWNARRIEQDKVINHDRNGQIHGLFYGVAIFINLFTCEWFLMLAMPLVGRLFFDTALNAFRGKGLFYVSEDAKMERPVPGASLIDWVEWHVFKNGWLPKVVYFLLLIIIIIIFYE
jgi:hypothetical protein